MSTVFIGWDVGAWGGLENANKKNDCISIVVGNDVFVGGCQSFSDYIFDVNDLDTFFVTIIENSFKDEGNDLKEKLRTATRVVVAADAVMSLPKGLSSLYGLDINDISKNFKRFLFRGIEEEIIDHFQNHRGEWPKHSCLSLLRDSIGSHSIKMLTFLNKFGFSSLGMNVFEKEEKRKYIIFETYPGFYIKHESQSKNKSLEYYDFIQKNMKSLDLSYLDLKNNRDRIDSVVCSLIARSLESFDQKPNFKMEECHFKGDFKDGYIWLPLNLDLEMINGKNKLK